MKKIHPRMLLTAGLLLVLVGLLCYRFVAPVQERVRLAARGGRTVSQVLAALRPAVEPRMQELFGRAGLEFPTAQLALLGIKDRQRLEVWAGRPGDWHHVVDYPFTAFSGTLGPKLREGDGQIPEGLYRIDALNPNSQYHLSMRVNYPNEFDRRMAGAEGRTNLGGDIYIHGRWASIGCVAIGDAAIEELFYMVATIGRQNVRVILAPSDLRLGRANSNPAGPEWLDQLYGSIAEQMQAYQPRGAQASIVD